jgi:tetratricopeptide (TPR) repeat protein
MENQSVPTPTLTPTTAQHSNAEWTATKVYSLGAICLVLGIVLGALFHGPAQPVPVMTAGDVSQQQMPGNPAQMPPASTSASPQGMMPQGSNPVFERLKSDPNNFGLLAQAGVAAMRADDAKAAIEYYGRALQVKEDSGVRTNLGNAYFRAGDVDLSLQQFATVLKTDPKNENALYNTGMVLMLGKHDPKGAIASWETFLKFYPDHPRKALVLEQINRAKNPVPKS